MNIDLLTRAPIGLLPVLIFLVALVYLDSYKLVGLRTVLIVIFAGALTLVAGYFANGFASGLLDINMGYYTRYVAPVIEESLKALVIIYMFRTNRIGFLVDAAIMGFAVGAGFGVVENFYYLYTIPDANMAVWIVRGFGTAIMHGGVTAMFAIMSQSLTERQLNINPLYYLPGFLVAAFLHSIFNHFLVAPVLQTIGTLFVLPPLLALLFPSCRVTWTTGINAAALVPR